MSIPAAAIRFLASKGLTADDIATLAEVMETASPDAAPTIALARPQQPAERVWVYVIAVDHPGDTLVKVGISKHPHYRLSTLEKERGYNLYLAHTEGPFSRSLAAAVERQAHQVLADEREKGEWFLCGAERATEVVQASAASVVA